MNKLASSVVTLGLLASSLFASDSYYIFSGSNVVAWGTQNYAFGYTWGIVELDNPANPYSPEDKDFINDGVGKILNAKVDTSSGVFISVKKSGNGVANSKSITDCAQGFSYWYKGGAHDFTIEYPKSNCVAGSPAKGDWNNKWRATATASDAWVKKSVPLAQLAQIPDGDCNKAVDLSIAEQLAWGTQTTVTGYNLAIGNVACLVDGAKDGDIAPTAGFDWVPGEEICSGYYCIWEDDDGNGVCGLIRTDRNNDPPITTCEAAISNCIAYSPSRTVYSNSTCTTSISSSSVDASSSSSEGSVPSSSSEEGTLSSSSEESTPSSSSEGGAPSSSSEDDTPIISYNNTPITGLNVTNFARNLRIASGKDATVFLFDIRGKQIFSQKVLRGTTTISLGKQRMGVYYVVARSGSQKQIVKIILK